MRKTLLSLILLSTAVGGLYWANAPAAKVNPPVLAGWTPPDAETRQKIEELPSFKILGGGWQDNERINVRLWAAVYRINGGQHLPWYYQVWGDCTAFGGRHAGHYLQVCQIDSGEPIEFHPIQPNFTYGATRHITAPKGKYGCNDQGASGYDTAVAMRDVGVLFEDQPGVPPYSGQLAQAWGCRGPPADFVKIAAAYKIKSFALIRSLDAARAALGNGYPITIASGWGYGGFDLVDGRVVARGNGSMSHQMCVIGYDGETGKEAYWYVQNSHPLSTIPWPPQQGEPPGGFWIRNRDMQRILDAGDSYAYSNLAGFPARKLESFKLFSHAKGKEDAQRNAARHRAGLRVAAGTRLAM